MKGFVGLFAAVLLLNAVYSLPSYTRERKLNERQQMNHLDVNAAVQTTRNTQKEMAKAQIFACFYALLICSGERCHQAADTCNLQLASLQGLRND